MMFDRWSMNIYWHILNISLCGCINSHHKIVYDRIILATTSRLGMPSVISLNSQEIPSNYRGLGGFTLVLPAILIHACLHSFPGPEPPNDGWTLALRWVQCTGNVTTWSRKKALEFAEFHVKGCISQNKSETNSQIAGRLRSQIQLKVDFARETRPSLWMNGGFLVFEMARVWDFLDQGAVAWAHPPACSSMRLNLKIDKTPRNWLRTEIWHNPGMSSRSLCNYM